MELRIPKLRLGSFVPSLLERRRQVDQAIPYVLLDVTCCKARVNRRVVSQAVVIATGAAADGCREILGFDAGDREDGAWWTSLLRSLKARGQRGVQLVTCRAHKGSKPRSAR